MPQVRPEQLTGRRRLLGLEACDSPGSALSHWLVICTGNFKLCSSAQATHCMGSGVWQSLTIAADVLQGGARRCPISITEQIDYVTGQHMRTQPCTRQHESYCSCFIPMQLQAVGAPAMGLLMVEHSTGGTRRLMCP